ncbi:MAG: GNAT family N-acetyltransferase [Rhizobiaceae bacterium]
MKAGKTIETDRLILRHWQADDLDAFHSLNSDETVMHFFPFRRSRAQSLEMFKNIAATVAKGGITWCAAELKQEGKVVGFTGLAEVKFEASFTPAVEIGWRFLPAYWGNGYASEAAAALLDHGFSDLGLSEIVAFAVPANTASTAVMKRIGMTATPELDFDMPGIDAEFAHLRRHAVYKITRGEWQDFVTSS